MANWTAASQTTAGAQKVARFLGYFSVGLGLLELVATQPLARALGMNRRRWLLRTYGLREIAAGLGILFSRRAAPWLWARAAGDMLDLAAVAPQLQSRKQRVRTANLAAAAAVAGIMALDIWCALKTEA